MRTLTLMIPILLLTACGTDKPLATEATALDMTGTFIGYELGDAAGTEYQDGIKLTLTQVGSAVTGTWENDSVTRGTVEATVSGGKLRPLKLKESASAAAPCLGIHSGVMSVSADGSEITGTTTGMAGNVGCADVVRHIQLFRL